MESVEFEEESSLEFVRYICAVASQALSVCCPVPHSVAARDSRKEDIYRIARVKKTNLLRKILWGEICWNARRRGSGFRRFMGP